mmetsp:Transcript_5673/g.13783  ORF Transcript_5673/g.13783 Transcript_5673/m.13783 type:complete len:212 (-) Transcript_5673:497-1132(-)
MTPATKLPWPSPSARVGSWVQLERSSMFFTCGWSFRMPVSNTPILTFWPLKPWLQSLSAWKSDVTLFCCGWNGYRSSRRLALLWRQGALCPSAADGSSSPAPESPIVGLVCILPGGLCTQAGSVRSQAPPSASRPAPSSASQARARPRRLSGSTALTQLWDLRVASTRSSHPGAAFTSPKSVGNAAALLCRGTQAKASAPSGCSACPTAAA